MKVSVRGLSKEDQHDLTRALKATDLVRGRMKLLNKRIRALPLSSLKSLLQSRVKVWRNIVKHRLEEYIKRFIFPLKELDTEGRLYLVFLEDFADPTMVSRTYSVLSNGPVCGGFNGARVNLDKALEALNKEVDISSKILMTAKDQSMNGPKHQREVLRLVKVSDTLR